MEDNNLNTYNSFGSNLEEFIKAEVKRQVAAALSNMNVEEEEEEAAVASDDNSADLTSVASQASDDYKLDTLGDIKDDSSQTADMEPDTITQNNEYTADTVISSQDKSPADTSSYVPGVAGLKGLLAKVSAR